MPRASLVLFEDSYLFVCLYYSSCCCCVLQNVQPTTWRFYKLNPEKEVIKTLTMSALPCRIAMQNCKTLLNHFQLLLPGSLRVILRKEKAGKNSSTSWF